MWIDGWLATERMLRPDAWPAGRTKEKLSATAGSVAATTRAVSSDGVHQLAAVEELRHISTEHFCLRGEEKSVL